MEVLVVAVIATFLCVPSYECVEIIDLSHKFSNQDMVTWPSHLKFNISTSFKGQTPNGVYYEEKRFCTNEHVGTHIDAPLHVFEKEQSVDEIRLGDLIGDGAVIDISHKTENDSDYQVTTQDILVRFNQNLSNNLYVSVRNHVNKKKSAQICINYIGFSPIFRYNNKVKT